MIRVSGHEGNYCMMSKLSFLLGAQCSSPDTAQTLCGRKSQQGLIFMGTGDHGRRVAETAETDR